MHPGFAAVALLLLLLHAAGPTVGDALRYERAAIATGQVWRLVTGHFVHFGWPHCLLNVAGLLTLAVILPARLRAWRCCLLLAMAVGVALYAGLPGLQHYAGFSGINYGLAALALLPRVRREPVAALVLLVLVARAAWQAVGGDIADSTWLGAPPVAVAHLAGLCGGAVCGLPALARIVGPATRAR